MVVLLNAGLRNMYYTGFALVSLFGLFGESRLVDRQTDKHTKIPPCACVPKVDDSMKG